MFVNAVMYYKVQDAESAVNEVDDYAESAKFISSTTLRNVLGTQTLGEILSETDAISQCIKVIIVRGSKYKMVVTAIFKFEKSPLAQYSIR